MVNLFAHLLICSFAHLSLFLKTHYWVERTATGQRCEKLEQLMEVLAGKNTRRPCSENSVAAASLVFVKGASVAEAAAELGLSRQVIHLLIVRLRRRMPARLYVQPL